MLSPDVVGVRLIGSLNEGVTANMTLRIVEMLREHGVVGKFVEFFGEGMAALLCRSSHYCQHGPRIRCYVWILPVDERTIEYLDLRAVMRMPLQGLKHSPRLKAFGTMQATPRNPTRTSLNWIWVRSPCSRWTKASSRPC